jgi:hypothetical protein
MRSWSAGFSFATRPATCCGASWPLVVGVGGTSGRFPADELEKFFLYNFIETVAKVTGQGAASCYSCGYGETCQVGIPSMIHGEGVKITPDMIPDVVRAAQGDGCRCRGRQIAGGAVEGNDHDRMVGHREYAERR